MRKVLFLTVILTLVTILGGCMQKNTSLVKPRQVIIDVRTPAEQQESGYIMGALLLEHTIINEEIKKAVPDTNTPIALYCRSGRRADMAKQTLNSIGYNDVVNLGGLEDAAKTLGIPVVKVK